MQFPDEIWRYIFSYFHSSFKKTVHFKSINYIINYNPKIGWQRVRNVHNNFYLYLLFNTMFNENRKNYNLYNLPIYRGIASLVAFKRINHISSPIVTSDFKEIRKLYLKKYNESYIVKKYINKDGNLNKPI